MLLLEHGTRPSSYFTNLHFQRRQRYDGLRVQPGGDPRSTIKMRILIVDGGAVDFELLKFNIGVDRPRRYRRQAQRGLDWSRKRTTITYIHRMTSCNERSSPLKHTYKVPRLTSETEVHDNEIQFTEYVKHCWGFRLRSIRSYKSIVFDGDVFGVLMWW